MAVDGKNASGRLAAGTVLWLLVAIFANQDYVYCEGEEQLQQQQLQQQQFQQRLQQQQQQPQQPNPSLMPPPPQSSPPQPPPQQQQQQQQPLPLPPQQQQQQPPPPPSPPQQQQQQQQRPQPNGMMGPINNMQNELQTNMNRLTGQPMNSDFVPNPLPQLQQQLSNIAGPSNIPGGNRIPTFSGGPPSANSFPSMQGGGPPQVSNFDEANLSQGINPYPPSMQTNIPSVQNQMRPPTQLNEQMNNGPYNNAQGAMNNVQDPNLQHKFTQMPQKPTTPMFPSQMQRFPLVHYLPGRQPMGQQNQRPYQFPNNYNSNDVQTNPQGIPGQSSLNMMNFGELPQMITSVMPTSNPLDIMQKPIESVLNSFGKWSRYGEGLKDGFTRAYKDVVGKIIDQSHSGALKILGMGSTGANALTDISRQLFIPESRGQQMGDVSGMYSSPQQSLSPNYGYNLNQQPPTHMTGYNMQPQGGGPGSFSGSNSYGQPVATAPGPGPQFNGEYAQQESVPNYGMSNPISASQPIFRFGG